ncbi:MAG: hypothetical protein NTW17_02265, partial [Candidatus Pacearchaeota archaeon]|nr:hypothetical protein [Candidatus Pacearchaeota archaeon]
MKKILISSIFAITFFLTVVTAVLISDQGTTVKNSTGYLLSSGNLTIEIYDSSTGGTVIANQTFADAIING